VREGLEAQLKEATEKRAEAESKLAALRAAAPADSARPASRQPTSALPALSALSALSARRNGRASVGRPPPRRPPRGPQSQRMEAQQAFDAATAEDAQLSSELALFAANDPAQLQRLRALAPVALAGANRWCGRTVAESGRGLRGSWAARLRADCARTAAGRTTYSC